MSEEQATDLESKPEGGGACRACCLGLLALVAAGILALVALNYSSGGKLDARQAQVRTEIAQLQTAAKERRGTVLGTPANDENAVVDYQGLEWLLTVGNEKARRESWRKQRPQLPADIDAMVTKTRDPQGEAFDLVNTGELVKQIHLRREYDESPEAEKKRVEARAAFARVRPALRYVRDGLSRGTCDWGVQWERGMEAEIPNLLVMRAVANLMAYEATLQSPREALQTGLQLVAFGQDIARQGTMIGSMIGVAVSEIGFASLSHTMGRPGLEVSDYRRLIEVLGAFEVPPVDSLIASERLTGVVTALQLSGRRLVEKTESSDSDDLPNVEDGVIFGVDLWSERELEGYEHFLGRAIEISRLPIEQREAARATMNQELEDSFYIVARIAIPNLEAIDSRLRDTKAKAKVVRVLAAAHVVRLDQGSFPAKLQDLSKVLGQKGLEDPSSLTPGAPLLYRLDGGRVLAWGVGENGVDDGGPQRGQQVTPSEDDSGFETKAPGK